MPWFTYTLSLAKDNYATVKEGVIQAEDVGLAANRLDELFHQPGAIIIVNPFEEEGPHE